MKKNGNISLKEATDEILDTSVFMNISKRTNKNFAKKLAIWMIRYILIISSMNESLNLNLETILLNLHGEKFKKIVHIVEKTFQNVNVEKEKYDSYIW